LVTSTLIEYRQGHSKQSKTLVYIEEV